MKNQLHSKITPSEKIREIWSLFLTVKKLILFLSAGFCFCCRNNTISVI